MTDLDKEERRFLNSGIEIAAGVAGAAAGLAVGGAPGALTGAAVGPALSASVRWATGEWASRQLSRRESQRVVSALDFAAAEINRRLEMAEKPRDDGFFGEGSDGRRPSAEELLEGTLLAAQRAHEEIKVKFLGYLYADIAFDSTLSPRVASYLVRLLDELSYTQLVALAVFTMNAQPPGILNLPERLLPEAGQSREQQALAHEIHDLFNRALLTQVAQSPGAPNDFVFSPALISPARTRPQGMGMTLSVMARLITAPGSDLVRLARALGSDVHESSFGS